jgi:PIN domain nuclease of toxin-antitoxin system
VKLLLDTHILLWVMQDARELKREARRLLGAAEEIHVSSASLWEAAIKAALGKLKVDLDRLDTRLTELGFLALPVTWAHARQVRQLPLLHRDPFDRMLIAQAISEPLHLLTHDAALAAYSDLVTVV